MLEGVLAEVLTRVLGQYVRGITRDTVNFGVWKGNLELRDLELHSEALGILFETFGLDLPITIRRGYIGLLRLEVPWKNLRSAPVRVVMENVTVVAVPSSEADAEALEERACRLKRARLGADDAMREARWGAESLGAKAADDAEGTHSAAASASWGWAMTGKMLNKIIDNIQIEIGDIWIQYQDGISDPDRPFAAAVRLRRLAVRSTDEQWNEVFIEETKGGLVHKKIELSGLSLDWDPISSEQGVARTQTTNARAASITTHGLAEVLESSEALRTLLTSSAAQRSKDYNHVISPVDATLRAQLRRSLRPGEEAMDSPTDAIATLDLDIPEFRLAMNEFQYGTFLRMNWHLGEFSKNGTHSSKPKTAKERWLWAADQVLPDYRDHFRAAWLRTPVGMRENRTKMLQYVALRLPILQTRRSGKKSEPNAVAKMDELEDSLTYTECMRFRDVVDFEYASQGGKGRVASKLWSYFGRGRGGTPASGEIQPESGDLDSSSESYSSDDFHSALGSSDDERGNVLAGLAKVRMGILIRQGSIALSHGGDDGISEPISKLDLHGLQVGFQSRQEGGVLVEALLETIEVVDSVSKELIMGSRRGSPKPGGTPLPKQNESLFPANVSKILADLKSASSQPENRGSTASLSRTSSSSWFGSHGSEERGASAFGDRLPAQSHIAALRMESAGDDFSELDRNPVLSSSLELSIGGLDGVINGPKGSFISSWSFWTPSSEPEPIMHFLASATASKIVALRMRIQMTLLARHRPMNLGIAVHAPRLIIPGARRSDPALVADFGRFSFDSSSEEGGTDPESSLGHVTYQMSVEDTGLFIAESATTMKPVHLLMRPASSKVKLRALQNASFIEAAAVHQDIEASKTALTVDVPAVSICLPQKGYRKLIALARTWGESLSQIGRNAMAAAATLSEANLAEDAATTDQSGNLRDLEVDLTLGECTIELRDKYARRLVMFRTSGSHANLLKAGSQIKFLFDTHSFAVLDGTRGTPAPFQKLAYAGRTQEEFVKDHEVSESFVKIAYQSEKAGQQLEIRFLSLNIVCMKEAYVELARFVYEVEEDIFKSPLEAVGISANKAAQKLKETGKDVVEKGSAVIAQHGALKVTVISDGVRIVVADANGALGDVEISMLSAGISETSSRGFECHGSIGGVLVRNLISKIDRHRDLIRYSNAGHEDGWRLSVPPLGSGGDAWFHAQFHGLRIVFVQKFSRALRYFVAGIAKEIQHILPVTGEKVDWGELFSPLEVSNGDWTPISMKDLPRLRLDVTARDVDLFLPRNSEDGNDALRLLVPETHLSNEDSAAEGYKIGIKMEANQISGYVLYPDPTISPTETYRLDTPASALKPFMEDNKIVIKVDWWRKGNQLGDVEAIRAALSQEEQGDLDAHYRLPSLRLRCFAPNGIHSTLSEADYSVLYLVLTENVFERVKDDDLVPIELPATVAAGLVLPPLVRVVFDVPVVTGIIAKGTDHKLDENVLIKSRLCNIQGSVDYGIDYRISASLSGNLDFVKDIRAGYSNAVTFVSGRGDQVLGKAHLSQDLDFSYDRGFRQKANLMLVVSGLKVNVVPELCLTMADLTLPGNPFLATTSFPELPPFFGRSLILTVSQTDLWIKTEEFVGDRRAMVVRGDFLAKVLWQETTRERSMEIVCRSLGVSLGDAPLVLPSAEHSSVDVDDSFLAQEEVEATKDVAFLYPCNINIDTTPDSVYVGGDNLLVRIAVNDMPLFLALASRLGRASRTHEERLRELYVDIPVVLFGDQEVLSTKISIAMARVVVTDEFGGKYVPIMEFRASNTNIEGRLPWMAKLWSRLSLDLFDEQNGWWVPGLEPWDVEFVASEGRSGSRAVAVRAEKCLNLNVSPAIVIASVRVSKVAISAIRHLRHISSGQFIERAANSSSTVRRPSVAAFSVRNESGGPMLMWLPKRPTRTQIKSGEEIEVDVDADQMMMSSTTNSVDRSALLRCYIALSGYNALSVSMNEIGAHIVSFEPDSESEVGTLAPLAMLWDVTMVDGVPCGLLRSMIRMLNETQSPIQICASMNGEVRETILPGNSWCVPLPEISHRFRVRPFLPISGNNSLNQPSHSTRFAWSDILPSSNELLQTAIVITESGGRSAGSRTKAPTLLCKGVYENENFSLCALPVIDRTQPTQTLDQTTTWLDLKFRPPLVLENLLPGAMHFQVMQDDKPAASGTLDPLQDVHIHTAGTSIDKVQLKVAFSNLSEQSKRTWGELIRVARSQTIPLCQANAHQKELQGSLERKSTVSTEHLRVFAPFWIKNRSDIEIRIRDRNSGAFKSDLILRGRPPSVPADPYVCISGRNVEFQQVGGSTSKSKWTSLPKDLLEIDKGVILQLENVSLTLDVRPAKGRFQRTLIATVRTGHWIENRTSFWLQWCRKEALNKKGIILQSDVHSIAPATRVAVHFNAVGSTSQAICIRPAEQDGSSDWIWSLAMSFNLYGELSSKMYRPKGQEQYLARVSAHTLPGGSCCLQICPEDKHHPPYRVVNDCSKRCIAFRQVGADKAHPWLIRPGKSTRYCWDEPLAPRKNKLLIVEVVESRGTRDVSLPEFQLNIDMVSKEATRIEKNFSPALLISVNVDGPTKTVRFWDEEPVDVSDPVQSGPPVVSWDDLDSSDKNSQSSSRLEDRQVAVDIDVWVHSIGLSIVDRRSSELAYMLASGVHWHIDSAHDSQLVLFEIDNLQLDNQLLQPHWPVLLWSPPPAEGSESPSPTRAGATSAVLGSKRPVAQFVLERSGKDLQGITMCKGIYASLQQLQISADEDFVLRIWQFFQAILDSQGVQNEVLDGRDAEEWVVSTKEENTESSAGLHRIYVEQLFLGPIKLIVSFAASRSDSDWRVGSYRALVRTLVAVLGNVENAELRFNALELHHAFDAAKHLQSLIQEYYVRQIMSQQLTLVTSNNLVGNPSALFDTIAIGAKDFFLEPANATSGLDFITSVGRGSHSLITNTVGGLFGSIGGIPRAMAQGLETAVGDREYANERASIKGTRGPTASATQGFMTGALSFGHGLASGATGLIRDPVEGAISSGASGFLKGLGKGVVGGVLKPLTGALDLIAEPASGIRNMMVAQQSGVAEPSRPPRFIRKTVRSVGRLLPYNLRDSIGKALLDAVNRGNDDREHESVVEWVELTPNSTRQSEGRLLVIWVLIRRFTRGDGLLGRMMKNNRRKDASGNVIRPEKDRICILTSQRVIIATLDGKLIWDCPISRVTDSQVSGQAKEYLLLGLRNGAVETSYPVEATDWTRIDCGSMEARDELDLYFKQTLIEKKMRWVSGQLEQGIELPEMSEIRRGNPGKHDRRLSASSEIEMTEVGKPRRDLCADIRSGPFSKAVSSSARRDQTLEGKVGVAIVEASSDALLRGRSVYVIIANRLEARLRLAASALGFGEWVKDAPSEILPRSVGCFKIDGSKDPSRDIRGSATYFVDENEEEKAYLGFVNPMLAANSYPVRTTSKLNVWYERGQGSRAVVVFSVALGTANEFQRLVRQPRLPDREVLLSPSIGRESRPAEGGLGIFETPLALSETEPDIVLPDSATVVKRSSAAGAPDSAEERESLVMELSGYGYPVEEARNALERSSYSMADALRFLTRG